MMRALLLAAVAAIAVSAAPASGGFVPGGGNRAADCYAGFDVTGVTSASGRIECTEGDACDLACGDGKCTFRFSICANQSGVSGCTPPAGGLQTIKAPGALQGFLPVDLGSAACGTPASVEVKLKRNGQKSNKRVFRTKAIAVSGATPRKDQDSFTFVCNPRPGTCPSSPSGAFLQ